jgi:hypothetical protein
MGVLDAMVEVAAYVLRSLSAPEARDLTLSLVPVLSKVVRDKQDRFSLPKWQAANGDIKRHQAVAELEHLAADGFVQRSSGDIVRYTPLWHAVKKVTAPQAPVFPPLVCIRALDAEGKGEVLANAVSNSGDCNLFVCDPGSFMALPGRTFGYWVSEKVRRLFVSMPLFRDNDGRLACITNPAGDDTRYFRCFWEPPAELLGRTKRWASLAKGGEFSRYYADQHLVVSWDDGVGSYTGFLGTPHRPLIRPASSDHFFRPGFTYSRRSQKGFSVRALPAGTIFHDKGPGIFASRDELLPLLAVFNSSVFSSLLALQMAFGSYEVGVIQRTPMPSSFGDLTMPLGNRALRLWRERRSREEALSTSHAFIRPALLATSGETLAERATEWTARERTTEETVSIVQGEIDELAFRLYGLDAADRAALTSNLATEATGEAEAEAGEDEEEESATADTPALTADLLAYALGCAFGRWDIRFAMGERPAPPAPDPFDPLPVCPPGMLQNAAGLPASSTDVPADYPLRITWPGILVDDPGNPEDIEARVRDFLRVLWPDQWEAIETEACQLLGVSTLRDFFRKQFFSEHLKRYSKSRRQAPIYWPLSTSSGSYTIWLYYQRFTKDTFYRVREIAEEKFRHEERKLFTLQQDAGPNPSTGQSKEIGAQAKFVDELREFRTEIARVAPLWNPNLNDGVILNFAPFHRLISHTKWRSDVTACWETLVSGKYDWAHLAMHLWPERVIPKCATDRSLAIAHGLDETFWEPDPEKEGRFRSKTVAESEIKRLIADRTSPAVVSARDALIAAPAGIVGRTRKARAK